MFRKVLFLLAAFSCAAFCQLAPPVTPPPASEQAFPPQKEFVVVTGTFVPAPLSENDRSVNSLDTRRNPLLFSSGVDYLQSDPTIDLQQRAPGGIQADLTILGSTFAENLVLVNGLRVNDSQTAHHDLDIPVPLESISRIEVLHGAGSTLYGADAMGGAVNFIATPALANEFRVRAGAGNDGFNQEHVFASLLIKDWSETIAADRDFSAGFRPDRDFLNTSASSETRFKSRWGQTDVLFTGSDRPFGADQFYGNVLQVYCHEHSNVGIRTARLRRYRCRLAGEPSKQRAKGRIKGDEKSAPSEPPY